MTNSKFSEIWAKSARDGKSAGESLSAHTANVISRLYDFSKIYPDLHLIVKTPDFWQYAFWACVFHDLGKVAIGFQSQLRQNGKIWGERHEILSLAFIQWIIPEIDVEWLSWIALGVASHHKDFGNIKERYPFVGTAESESFDGLMSNVSPGVPLLVSEWLLADYRKWTGLWNFPGKVIELNVGGGNYSEEEFFSDGVMRMRKSLMLVAKLKRRMEEGTRNSSDRLCGIAMRGIVTLSDHIGSAHKRPATVRTFPPEEFTLLLVPSSSALYSHQQRSAESNDNSILVAPTGSGKTESALLWLNRQKYNLAGAGRFFYVLPYQASLNAMYLRLAKIIPGNVTLQHSRSLQALFKLLLDKGYSPIQASIVAKQERSLAKLHHFGVRVLTPYQLLRAAFQLKGFEALITDCAGAHIVFDEIHAYETKRLGMILGLIEYLRENWQCRFFIMSATLPSLLSKHLAAALEHYVDIRADKQIFQQFVRHKLHIISSLVESSTVISQIMESANNGEAVLVVCNTVKKASAVFQELHRKADGLPIKVSLLHSRFNARDRLRKERELMTSMGTIIRERKDNEGMILVATQVVEVSLDIDFDRLFSEVAPMESLVQRFGRINRGRKHATCPVHILTEPGTGQHVYDDRIIERVLQLLPELDGQIIDESMISAWLDRIYEGSLVMEMEAELLSSKQEFMAVCINELVALDTSEDLNDRFDKMFDGTEVLPAQFLDEFEQLSQQDTLLAGDMFVPISYRQLSQLKRSGKIEQRQYLNIAHVPYSSEHGLEL